jgi:hypothetical protein
MTVPLEDHCVDDHLLLYFILVISHSYILLSGQNLLLTTHSQPIIINVITIKMLL